AVEDKAVVIAAADQLLHPLDMSRREIGPHADDHPAVVEVQVCGVFGVGRGRLARESGFRQKRAKRENETDHGGPQQWPGSVSSRRAALKRTWRLATNAGVCAFVRPVL